MSHEPSSFGLELRVLVDSMFERPAHRDNPVWRLVNDSLPLAECRDFYLGMRDSLEVFNRILLPRLVESAPTPRLRRELLPVITVEFGSHKDLAHPSYFERFLAALGVPADKVGPGPDVESSCRDEIEAIRKMSWCELLARILVGETLGPVSFPLIADALQRNYGLSGRDVEYFRLHAAHDKRDTEILLGLLQREAPAPEQRDRVVRTIQWSFDQGRYKHTACALAKTPAYRFRDAGRSLPPDHAEGGRVAGGSVRPRRDARDAPARFPRWITSCLGAFEGPLTSSRTPMGSMFSHALPRRELAALWGALSPALEFLETHAGPRLLELSPALETRVALWSILRPRYGYDDRRPSQPERLARFLGAIGAAEGGTSSGSADPLGAGSEADFHRLLAESLLAPLLVERVMFPAVRRALAAEPYSLTADDLAFFDVAIENAESAFPVAVQLAAQFFETDEQRAAGEAAILEYARAFVDGRAPGRRAAPSALGASPELVALTPEAFERKVRGLCDAVYETPSAADNPMAALMRDELSLDEARAFWGSRWNRVLVLTRHVLPNLLRRSPDLETAVALWPSISVEYGGGSLEKAHAVLYRRFVRALGVPEDAIPMALPVGDAAVDAEVARLEGRTWYELLGEFLARETVGPKVFGLIAARLKTRFGLSDAQLEWFTVHSEQDVSDADDMFALARKFARTAAEQDAILGAVRGWFERNPWYCCKLGASPIRFSKGTAEAPPLPRGPAPSATTAPRFRETCLKCGKSFTPDRFNTRCDACGGLIDISYDLARVEVHDNERDPILRYRDLIPVHDPSKILMVGAGNSPCIHARRLGKKIGLPDLFLKNETTNPSKTVKDRTAEVVLSYLNERGIYHFTSSATGNSSTAFARACIAHAPFEHSIFIGARWLPRLTFDAHPRIHVWVLEGDVPTVEAISFSRTWEKANGVPPEGGFFNSGRREGLKLAFLESVDQLQSSVDWYVQGVSTAMGAYGSFKGALQYMALGRLDRLPKMALAQEATCCPQVNAFSEKSSTIEARHIVKKPDGIADALLKGDPSDTYPYIHGMLTRVGGALVSVSAEEITTARSELLEYEGVEACNASSTTLAAIKKLVASGQMKSTDRVLAMITGGNRDLDRHVRQYTRVTRGPEGWVTTPFEER